MSSSPDDRVYAESHEWFLVDGETVTVGLSAFAVDQLTDVTFVEMKPPGTEISVGESLGEVESVKTTSDVFAAVGGEILEVNSELEANPGLINEDPYGQGWLVKMSIVDRGTLGECVDASAYDKQHD